MKGRTRARYGQLTSLVDMLFILLFATLVQQRRAVAAEQEAERQQAEEAAAALESAAKTPADLLAPARAVSRQLVAQETVLVAINASGNMVSVERDGKIYPAEEALLARTGDARILRYVADDEPDQRLCLRVARAVHAERLGGRLLLITTERPVRQLPYALVAGVVSDLARCVEDIGSHALLLRPEAKPGDRP